MGGHQDHPTDRLLATSRAARFARVREAHQSELAEDYVEMIDDLATQTLLGPFRGEPAVDRDALVEVLVGLSDAAV